VSSGDIVEYKENMMKTRGFTLIELLVVMAILGIMMTLGLSSYGKSLSRGRDAKRIEDMQTIQKGFELYYAKYDEYAACRGDEGTMEGDTALFPSGLPNPPAGSLVYTYMPADCGSSGSYCVCTGLENPENKVNSGENCDFGADPKTLYCVASLQ
jgi:prepilin-type N-terminal cleavage/methylation domain-containing protein